MQPRQSQGIGVEHSQRGEYGIGHAEVQRGSPSGGRQQGQQEQHDHDDLRGEPYMEEQHEVRHQQKEEPRARIERPAGQEDGAEAAGEQGAHQCGDAHHHEVQGRKHADGDEVGDLQFAGFGGLVELVRGFGGRVRCGHDVFRFVCIDNIPLANLTMISRKAIVCL